MNRKKILIPIIILTAIIILLIIILNPSHRYKKMSVSESKWESIKRSREENSNLVLESIKFNDYNLIIDKDNSKIYYSVVNDNKTKYNPNISYTVTENSARLAILQEEITSGKIQANYEFKLMIYNNSQYHIYSLICMDFPVLNISCDIKSEKDLKNLQADIYLFDNLSNMPNKVTRSRGKLDILENGEYKLSLNMLSPGKDKRKNNISLFGMNPYNEYTLYPLNDEKSMTNEGHYIELFVNNEYVGLYSLEHFKPDNKK